MSAVEVPVRRRLVGIAGVAVAVFALAGCSAGQAAQTVEQTSVVDGTGFQAGQVDLRDVGLRAPLGTSYSEGDVAYLSGLMVNNARDNDQLVSVSSPLAQRVEIYTDGVTALLATGTSASESAAPSGSASESPSSTASSSAGASESPSATEGASPTEGATATGSASSSSSASASATTSETTSSSSAAAPSPLSTVTLPSQQAVRFGYENDQLAIVFVGLTEAIFPGQTFEITFTFANGGSVTHMISVKLPSERPYEAPTIDTHGGGGENGEAEGGAGTEG